MVLITLHGTLQVCVNGLSPYYQAQCFVVFLLGVEVIDYPSCCFCDAEHKILEVTGTPTKYGQWKLIQMLCDHGIWTHHYLKSTGVKHVDNAGPHSKTLAIYIYSDTLKRTSRLSQLWSITESSSLNWESFTSEHQPNLLKVFPDL